MTIQQAFELALGHHQSGRLAEAEAIYRQILAAEPRHSDVLHLLGVIAHQMGRNDDAVDLIRQAIALAPGAADFHSNLGIALYGRGQLDEAIAAYGRAIALNPNLPEAHSNLGNALKDKDQLDEAIAAYRYAIALKPRYAEAHSNLGVALQSKGRLDEAIAAFRQAIALRPDYPEACYNLGNTLTDKGQFDEAIASYRQAIARKPHYPEAHNNLGNALKEMGRVEEAITAYGQAIAVKSDLPEAHSNVVLALHYLPGVDARTIAEEHHRWQKQHAEPLRSLIRAHANDRDPHRRLRVGYVSPDFREHSVAFFVEALLARHDPAQVEVFCYSNLARSDAVTARLQGLAAHWRDIFRRSDAGIAERIREDKIDILVDLAGHTANNRLLLFARKPAPVQVSWLGYPDSTGLEAIDYRLTDALADPPGATEHLHSEQLFRLPQCAWCYHPPGEAPSVSALPGLATGQITFGSFNALPKVAAPQLRWWADILMAVPGSRLLLKNRGFQNLSTQKHLRSLLAEWGVAQERIELAAYASNLSEHLALYGRVDIALDTFPYHGTTTTCEALWMGVPVVTLAGKTHASRAGVSLLTNAGLPECIAHSEEEYRQMAITLAGDLPRLNGLRQTLRSRLEQSPLLDAPRFARDMETAFRTVWQQRWCTENHPALP